MSEEHQHPLPAQPPRTRDWAEAIQREVYGNRAGVADLIEQLVMGDREDRAAAADALKDTPQAPAEFKSMLPDPDSPIYRAYRALGRSMVFMCAAAELGQLGKAFKDPELDLALRQVYGRALEHLLAAQRQLGIRK